MNLIRKLRAFLKSRELFRNWFSAGLKYYLSKYGLDVKYVKIKCDNDREYTLSRSAYFIVVNAYFDGFFKLLCDGDLVGRFWGVVDLLDKDGSLILRMPDGCVLDIDSFYPLILAETWLYEIHYLGFDLTNWFVLDIGAFVGDTALYYAKRGAFVVAVEPLPSNYETMMKNLSLNPDLKPRIIPINAAVAGEDGFMDFKYSGRIDGGASAYTTSRFTARVRSMKLSTLIKELEGMGIDINQFKVRVLKADCKGCEYEVVDDDALRLFDIVKIEYSGYLVNKTYHVLKEKLEAKGFRCRAWAHNDWSLRIGLDRHGTLTCIKLCKNYWINKEGLML
jgi:methyltransferase, FkbM family